MHDRRDLSDWCCLATRPGASPGLSSGLLTSLLGTPRGLLGGLIRRLGTLLARLARCLHGLQASSMA